MTIRSSAEPPSQAHVAINYQDYWYYIDRSDFPSKRAFSMLILLFNLQSTDETTKGPVLTLPAGR